MFAPLLLFFFSWLESQSDPRRPNRLARECPDGGNSLRAGLRGDCGGASAGAQPSGGAKAAPTEAVAAVQGRGFFGGRSKSGTATPKWVGLVYLERTRLCGLVDS